MIEHRTFNLDEREIPAGTWRNLLGLIQTESATLFKSSRRIADDRPAQGPLGRVERGDGFVERRDSPDSRVDLFNAGFSIVGSGRDSGELIPRRPRLEQVAHMGGERLDGCRDKGRARANGEDACLARSLHGWQDPD